MESTARAFNENVDHALAERIYATLHGLDTPAMSRPDMTAARSDE